MVYELMGWGFLFSSMPYGESWRRRRRLFQRFFLISKPSEYELQQRNHIRHLLPKLIGSSEHSWAQALRQYVTFPIVFNFSEIMHRHMSKI
jgi:hypothetical protein